MITEIGCEDTDISLTAEHDDLFIIDRDTAEFLRRGIRDSCLEAEPEVEADIHRVIATVERHIANGYVCPDHVRAFTSEACCVVDGGLAILIDEHADILDTILISCGVVYFIDVDTGRFIRCGPRTAQAEAATGRGSAFFRHLTDLLWDLKQNEGFAFVVVYARGGGLVKKKTCGMTTRFLFS